MYDRKAWMLALSRLRALRSNPPYSITEARVADYHGILNSLASASGEDLSCFRIPYSDMQREASGIPMFGRHQRKITYSTDLYGDEENFKRQVEAAYYYVQNIDASSRENDMNDAKNLWSMSDHELEMVARENHVDSHGDGHGIDRPYIIAQVQKRRKAFRPERPSVRNEINVKSMNDSVIQQDSDGSLRLAAAPIPSRFSPRTIMEGVLGSLLAAGLIFLISHFWHS